MDKLIVFGIALIMITVFSAFTSLQQFCSEDDFSFEIIDNGRAVKITGYVGENTDI